MGFENPCFFCIELKYANLAYSDRNATKQSYIPQLPKFAKVFFAFLKG
jgi:hypothetical protein